MNLSKYLALLQFIYSREDKIGSFVNILFLVSSFLILFFTSTLRDFGPFGAILSLITLAFLPARWWIFYCIGIKSHYNLAYISTVPKLYSTISRLSLFLIFFIAFSHSSISVLVLSQFPFSSENLTFTFFSIVIVWIFFTATSLAVLNININKRITSALLMLSFNTPNKSSFVNSNFIELFVFDFLNTIFYKNFSSEKYTYVKRIENLLDLGFLVSPIYHISILIVNLIMIFFIFFLNTSDNSFFFELSFSCLFLWSCFYNFYTFYDIRKVFLKASQEKSIVGLLPIFSSKENINMLLGKFLVRYFFISLFFAILFNLIVSLIIFKAFHQNLFDTIWFILFTPLFFCFILKDYNEAFKNPLNQVFLFSSILLSLMFTFLLNSLSSPYFLLMKIIGLIFIAGSIIWAYFLWKDSSTSSALLPMLYPD